MSEIRIRLSDKDRDALGVEQEWLSVDPFDVSMNETVVLQKGVEIEGVVCSYDSAQHWRVGISKGEPFASKVLIWLGLRRAGIKVDLGKFDTDSHFDWELTPEATDPGEPGKDPSTPGTTS